MFAGRDRVVFSSASTRLNLIFLPYPELMMLEQNPGLMGDLTPLCEELPILKLSAADCGGDNPQIVCECCLWCCDPTNPTDCAPSSDDFLAQYDPHWWSGYNRQGDYLLMDYNITDDEEGDGNRKATLRL